jgi:tetratricopeptide (TPR) repeat protein
MKNTWLARAVDFVFGYDFFISYSHDDGKNLPALLQGRLEESGFRVFLDQSGYVVGTDLRRETGRQVRKSRKLVVLARPRALVSTWVKREVDEAVAAGGVPVMVDINTSMALAAPDAVLAALAREKDWLRLEETLSDPDGEPSDRLISELIRSFSHTRQETWRIRVFAGVAVLFAGIAAAAGVMAYAAETQRRLAERNLVVARSAADVLVVDIARDLRDVKGMDTTSLHKILSKAREAFDKLAASAPDDLVLLQSRLVMYNEFVETYLAQGDTSNARSAAQESLKLAEGLPQDSRLSIDSRVLLGRSLTKTGDVLEETGDLARSLEAHLRALAIRRALLQAQLDVPDRERDVAISLGRLAQIEIFRGKPRDALPYLEESLQLRKRLAPVKKGYQRDLALAHIVMSDALLAIDASPGATDMNDPFSTSGAKSEYLPRAAEHAVAAARLFEWLLNDDQTSSKAARDYAIALQRQGNIALQSRDFAGARKFYEASAERFSLVAQGDVNNLEWRRDVLVAQGKLAATAADAGDRQEAAALLTKLIESRGTVVASNADNHIWRIDLIEALRDKMALVPPEEAIRLNSQALGHLQELEKRKALGVREKQWFDAMRLGERGTAGNAR